VNLSAGKSERLRRLSTDSGVIAAIAVDQRKSLRMMIAQAAGVPFNAITDAQIGEFKCAVASVLTPHASAILIDPEFGSCAFGERAPGCGLLTTYEMDGYENPRPYRMLALMPEYSVRRLRDLGADGIKILLSWTPFDEERPNDDKRVLIERIGAECAALDMPFFLEPVGYDPGGQLAPNSADYARIKPKIVIETMREFSKDIYNVDVLKVEFPVNAAYVEGTRAFKGERVWTRGEALEVFRQADAVAGRPYIYLSAGVSSTQFLDALTLAAEAGAHYSGVLCGRATWQDGIPVFAREGRTGFERWLAGDGVANVRAINECLRAAYPWTQRTAAA
jgi:tagatose 1,6-diphosphate aldolase